MIERILKSKLIEMANKYPIVTLTGPRQSGKSTLLRNSFQDYEYVSLEDPEKLYHFIRRYNNLQNYFSIFGRNT